MKAYSIEDLRRQAQRRLPRAVFDFIDGGAEDELTLRENRAAFDRVRLQRRVLVLLRLFSRMAKTTAWACIRCGDNLSVGLSTFCQTQHRHRLIC